MCPSTREEAPEKSPAAPTDSRTSTPLPRQLRKPTHVRNARSLPSARPTPSLRSRRSVSSMKTLMPFTLSPSCSNLWSAPSAEEPLGERDDYFPEVLARDLELSTGVFASKSMTAGPPVSSLSFEDRGRINACRMALSSPYRAASARVRSLGPIEERTSRVSFTDPQGPSRLDAASDADSRSTTQASEDTAPASLLQRESVMTAATSLASTSWKPSLKRSLPPDGLHECSWIDGDSDSDCGSDAEEQDVVNHGNRASLPPRPPTPPESDLDPGVPNKIDVRGHWGYNETPLHRKSHSVSGGSPTSPRRKLSGSSLEVPLRPASTAGIGRRKEGCEAGRQAQMPPQFTPRGPVSARQAEARPSRPRRGLGLCERPRRKAFHINVVAEPSPASTVFPDSEADSMPQGDFSQPISPAYGQATSPRPTLRSVQSWLNGSLQPLPRSLPGDDVPKVVPLPPDAMETLRVSIACFPETMLLTKSLTIETIRTYSRKVRQPSLELLRSLPVRSPSPESPTYPNRKSLWRNLVPYMGRRDAPEPKQRHNHSSGANSVDSSVLGLFCQPKPWEPLKAVFGGCSDYICDALYAHIVAYNYVSALVARNPPSSAKAGRGGGCRDSQQEDIPKKAASLLGLAAGGDAAPASFNASRRFGSPLGAWAKEEMVTSQPMPSANHEMMQVGLLRCISRLVATAKLMAETGAEDETINAEADDTDMLFVRSLCEIVRMAEEAC